MGHERVQQLQAPALAPCWCPPPARPPAPNQHAPTSDSRIPGGGLHQKYGVKPWTWAQTLLPASVTPNMRMMGTGPDFDPGTE